MNKLATDHRRRELAQIHVAKKQLMDAGKIQSDDDYRAMLWTQGRVRSSADLDHAGRQKVIDYLRGLGVKDARRPSSSRTVRTPLTPTQKLMWSLWQQLADAKKVKDRRMAALVAFAKRQTNVDKLQWLNGPQEALVIDSLKRWLARSE